MTCVIYGPPSPPPSPLMCAVKHASLLPPFSPTMPKCPLCGGQPKKEVTRTSNRNGNSGRPYLKCWPCKRFVTFWDYRGLHPVNKHCDCDKPSRLQVASKAKGRKLHYVCGSGECSFYQVAMGDNKAQISLTDDVVGQLASLSLI